MENEFSKVNNLQESVLGTKSIPFFYPIHFSDPYTLSNNRFNVPPFQTPYFATLFLLRNSSMFLLLCPFLSVHFLSYNANHWFLLSKIVVMNDTFYKIVKRTPTSIPYESIRYQNLMKIPSRSVTT